MEQQTSVNKCADSMLHDRETNDGDESHVRIPLEDRSQDQGVLRQMEVETWSL